MKRNAVLNVVAVLGLVTAISLVLFSKSDASPSKKDPAGISFIEQDWDKALKAAKTQKKLVFLDIYATWCGPCKMLKKNTFTDAKVADFFNKNFVNVSVDGEKGVGPQLAQKFSIQAYPTLIVANADGTPVLYTMGYLDPATLLQFANAALQKK
ncbi:MAG TPA: thioredoxin family protein [Chitinophagaceae bacterium]|nr:thioredoxin family protein [Chitinophagaceae bacterium]